MQPPNNMAELTTQTPVAFLIFNRADNTEKVFQAIRKAKPPKLLVIADGPRAHKIGEAEKCEKTRAIIDRVDWDCEVYKNYSEQNMGCARRVSSGLNWVFEQVEEAIILEDDCVPHPTFFPFCDELLDRYRDDERIVVISGQNVQFGRHRAPYSYYFSRHNHCWGWATWKRAWQHFDFEMKNWPEVRDRHLLNDILHDSQAVEFWTDMFQSTYAGKIDSWAYRWTFSCWTQNGLSILSNVNLISNIGFGKEGTNITASSGRFSKYANMITEAIQFPMTHPPHMIRDAKADDFTQKTLFMPRLRKRLASKLHKLFGL